MQPIVKNQERAKCFDLELLEFDGSEEVVCEIRKHPFGLFVIYATGIFIGLVILISGILSSVWLDRHASSIVKTNYSWVALVIGIVLTLFVLVMTYISSYLYRHDVILVTNEKIAETIYKTIFNRSVSQLGLGEVQDVTVFQKGIIARMFNFGTILIETAGEKGDFNFTFAPRPFEYSKEIIAAHEENTRKYGN